MHVTMLATFSLGLTAISVVAAAQSGHSPILRADKGPHAVGFRVVEQYDRSRTFSPRIDALGKPNSGELSRPLQTLIWYPAENTPSKFMTVGDYVALKTTETSFGKPRQSVGLEGWLIAGMEPAYSTTTWAVRDAPPSPKRFPVVIYAPSFSSTAWENADLCEYLASFGYVVLASPGMGITRESTHDVAGVNAQAQDISFLIGYAETLPDTDMSEAGVVGFSWGGLANLFAAARDSRIDALVALDGSMRYFPGLVKQAGDVNPAQMTLPLLFFKGQGTLEDQARLESNFNSEGPSVLNAWTHGDLFSIQMLGLVHPEFTSMAQRNERFWRYEAAGLQQADYGREDAAIGYSWTVRYTREFLDAYLKHDAEALAYMKATAANNGVPTHVMAVRFQKGSPLPDSFETLRIETGRQGFNHVAEVYAAIRKNNADLKLDANSLTSWAYDLLAGNHVTEAISVMRLSVQLDPSSRAYGSLGEMYAIAGQRQAALESYRTSLEKDGNNIIAKQSLEALESTPTSHP